MDISTCVKFKGGFPMPTEIVPAPGKDLTAHILGCFRKQGIQASDPEELEYGNTIRCTINKCVYEVEVSFDWITYEWWDVMYTPTVGLFARLFGASEVHEMQLLTRVIDSAIREIKGISDIRWYTSFPTDPENSYSPIPVGI